MRPFLRLAARRAAATPDLPMRPRGSTEDIFSATVNRGDDQAEIGGVPMASKDKAKSVFFISDGLFKKNVW